MLNIETMSPEVARAFTRSSAGRQFRPAFIARMQKNAEKLWQDGMNLLLSIHATEAPAIEAIWSRPDANEWAEEKAIRVNSKLVDAELEMPKATKRATDNLFEREARAQAKRELAEQAKFVV